MDDFGPVNPILKPQRIGAALTVAREASEERQNAMVGMLDSCIDFLEQGGGGAEPEERPPSPSQISNFKFELLHRPRYFTIYHGFTRRELRYDPVTTKAFECGLLVDCSTVKYWSHCGTCGLSVNGRYDQKHKVMTQLQREIPKKQVPCRCKAFSSG